MAGWGAFTDIVGYHVIPALLASIVLAVELVLLFGPLRVHHPRHRVWFLYAALGKAALAICMGAGLSSLMPEAPVYGIVGIRFPNLVADNSRLEPNEFAVAFANSGSIGVVIALVILCWLVIAARQWLRLAPFLRRIYLTSAARPQDYPELYQTLLVLVDRLWTSRRQARPQLLILDSKLPHAFTVGILHPTIIFSRQLAHQLGPRELRGLVAHELAHARALDYFGRWFSQILRDLMAWNPLAWWCYRRLVWEQERAADDTGALLLSDPEAVAAGLVELAALQSSQKLKLPSFMPRAGGDNKRELHQRLAALSHHTAPVSTAWSLFLLGLFLLVQPQLSISLPNLWRLLFAGS